VVINIKWLWLQTSNGCGYTHQKAINTKSEAYRPSSTQLLHTRAVVHKHTAAITANLSSRHTEHNMALFAVHTIHQMKTAPKLFQLVTNFGES
jgi:hypothetical protein